MCFFFLDIIFILIICFYFYILFFFFQAEDGIRDTSVTGVQTCALPILGDDGADRHPGDPVVRGGEREMPRVPLGDVAHAARSEERRVGKECRSRWSADD